MQTSSSRVLVRYVQHMRDDLLVAPVMISMSVTEFLITMGADSFTNFVLSFFVELSMSVLERLYLDPAIKAFFVLWRKWVIQCRRAFRKNRVMLTREQRKNEDREWKKVLEDIARETEGVEPLLDSFQGYSIAIIALILAPLVQFFLLLTDTGTERVTQIPEMYAIRGTNLIYYTIFSVVIIFFTLVMDMFLLNALELIHGWRLYDYVSYQQYRFSVREKRWQLYSTEFDEAISGSLQRVDLLCFSSQYYFVVTLGGFSIFLILMGWTIFFRADWNLFADPALPILLVVCWAVFKGIKNILMVVCNLVGLWRLRGNDGAVTDDVDAKLKIGDLQKDKEMEEMELRALNSERFRHRFLERARPWLLQHLTELLTPRTLSMLGPDGRPNIEYIRDVYHQLVQMGEGARAEGDRSDISSDDEDADELMAKQRANWSRKPLEPSARAMIMLWLNKVCAALLFLCAASVTVARPLL